MLKFSAINFSGSLKILFIVKRAYHTLTSFNTLDEHIDTIHFPPQRKSKIMETLELNRQHILQAIQAAEIAAQRVSGSVQLIAVSKTFPADDIRALYAHGQRAFGENYVQEWQDKVLNLQQDCPDIEWHIIGHVQSNKTRPVAEYAHWLHTVSSLKTAQRLNNQRPSDLPPLNICIEINISGETAKHGIAPDEMLDLARAILPLPNVRLRGLMCVASADVSDDVLRQQFTRMADSLRQLQTICATADTLSMGMSGDLNVAIACGATMVRVGSAIFGKRNYA